MKKFSILLVLTFILVGCGSNSVTQSDLQANEWTLDISHIEPKTPLIFDVEVFDRSIELTAQPDSVANTYTEMTGNDNESARALAATQSHEFDQVFVYEMDGSNLNLTHNATKIELRLTATKVDNDILLRFQDDEENNELVQNLLSSSNFSEDVLELTLIKK